jgi:Tol biopolymer transport system component
MSRGWVRSRRARVELGIAGLGLLLGFAAVGGPGCSAPNIAPPANVFHYVHNLAFARAESSGSNIYIMTQQAGVGNIQKLTARAAARNEEPAWSPDGAHIAFVSGRDGNREIYVMDRDGGHVTRLTNNAATDRSPAWSPDGSLITFTSERSGTVAVYTMHADGSNVTRVTANTDWNENPCWAPGGAQLGLTIIASGATLSHVYRINADGTGQERLGAVAAREIEPDWSPSLRIISCRSDDAEGAQIWIQNADGSNPVRLTDGNPSRGGWHPTWSYDGTRVVFVSDHDGHPALWMIDATGQNLKLLGEGATTDFQPDWGPEI